MRNLVSNPPNPWAHSEVEYIGEAPRAHLQVYEDATRSIVSRNDSPDLGFDFSVNPYRGCMHGCAYCYARRTHEYLDFGAGSDFERKIVVKPDAAELLRRHFERPSWRGAPLAFSGVTDCYQPLEAEWRLTRACLEVCVEYRNPALIITKSPLIERDIDVLCELGRVADVGVMISVPLWDPAHARAIEPWVPAPQRRIESIRRLREAGIRTGVMVAPLIPGLGDEEMPSVLEAAAAAGATHAGTVDLRLPGSVALVFEERIREAMPTKAEGILKRVREARGGRLNDARFGSRMMGTGPHADATRALFKATCRRLGLGTSGEGSVDAAACETSTFERPSARRAKAQLDLF